MKVLAALALVALGVWLWFKQQDNSHKLQATIRLGETFLAREAEREGVQRTATGLLYEVLEKGLGKAHPVAGDTVTVHYHGTLPDGTVFDSSRERGEPINFGLNQVIRGWTEGLQLMRIGDKYRFVIPYNLAYGKRSPSAMIPAGSTLVFEVELLAINGEAL